MSLPKPSFGSSMSVVRDLLLAPTTGPFHRRQRGLRFRAWRLIYRPGQAAGSDFTAVRTLWETNGTTIPFSWTPPTGGAARNVLFTMDSFDFQSASIRAHGFEVTLIEEDPIGG